MAGLRSPVGLSFVLAAAAVLATGAGAYWNTRAVAQATGWVSHTHQVQSALEQVLSLLKDVETGQRGYLLTGRDEYLQPYRDATAQIDERLDALQALIMDNPAQQERIALLRQQAAQRLTVSEEIVRLLQDADAAGAMAVFNSGRGKAAMDGARALLVAMRAEEDQLLNRRVAQAQATSQRSAAFAALTTALVLSLLATAFVNARRAAERVRASEQSLRRSLEAAEQANQALALQIQERERAEEDLRRSQALTQAIIEGSTSLVYAKDLQGRYFLTNRAWHSLVHMTAEEAQGADDVQVFGPDIAEQLRAADRRVIDAGATVIAEETVMVAGRPRTYLSSKFPLREADGGIYAVCGVSTDITELKTAQQEVLRLNARLEERVAERTRQLSEANQELEAFSYTVSHDLRAPLRGLQGFAQAVHEDYGERLDGEGRDYLGRIIAAARRMEGLIQDLLDYGRLARQELQLRPIHLGTAATEALGQLAAEIDRTRASVQVEQPLPAVLAHPAVLVQVLANLVGNAVKFARPGAPPRVRIHAELRGARVRTWVDDQGIGIQPEHQERIFQVFERLHGQESYPGTGVGLAIVRKGCARMGGECGVQSRPGEGSRFWFELDVAEQGGATA